MIIDKMKISRRTRDEVPDYGTLFLIQEHKNSINEYGGETIDDAVKLDLITNAAPGSTCLFTNGDLYRKESSGWHKMGEEPAAASDGEETAPTQETNS